jgi:transcriptional regulator with XRE-family HTH domain
MDDIDLREMRRAKGISQQKLAQEASCSVAMVALFERGYRPASSAIFARVVATLKRENLPAGTQAALDVPRLRAMREQMGLTRMQLAAMSGVSPGAIRNAEVAAVASQRETLMRLCNALGCDISAIR